MSENKSLFDLKGKFAIVTGASSGLGVQFAHALVRQGAAVALFARREEKLDKVVVDLEKMGGRAIAIQCDVSNPEQVDAAVKQAHDAFGRIDILVNNAGIIKDVPAESTKTEDWKAVIDTNVNGTFYVARAVAKYMIEQKYGKIINTGSIHSSVAIHPEVQHMSAYATSKGGIHLMTRALAAEWAKYNITVNAIGPGCFPSEMTEDALEESEYRKFIENRVPMKRHGRDGELDGALIYFASDASTYTTGQLLKVDGGWTSI
ncbi:putative 3-oxoacyl-[acyl-carrier protein] reductase [Monocercomonoides exilis]|uniref:putative 3-oxoacyl-[acyl-carrier protein] reductase n=1 Tax=Monocercomonoides exilis TaxID=2049356 RepID=UPI0035595E3E|nr:putative 3-oxoacyl-[acyl-carrier protein] reductase [Monocercomonoides exilis]|eukprot:MONOS_2776.1-p1 / transcript=MONOS_2776.1 / gene=MONOS_2776 / organism=Monocercomonoides_exilis_PA203 / gene_product=unspecified product / transcript_product=unspecified product / location=Mono_scaffold00059:88200-88982(-) / protein_length=261 / sequence_SO=supercontig / SO=protein_coding / is_pseudo=false